MIKKSPFLIKNVLDETIYFEFKDGVQETYWTNDNKRITLRSFIDGNINDAEIFPQYAELKKENERRIQEIFRLRKLLEPFEKNKGVGRRKGSFKLKPKQIEKVLELKKSGMSNIKIAEKFKVNEKTIRNILKRNSLND